MEINEKKEINKLDNNLIYKLKLLTSTTNLDFFLIISNYNNKRSTWIIKTKIRQDIFH